MKSSGRDFKSWILLLYIVLIPILVIPFTFKMPIIEYWNVDYFILPKTIFLIVITIIFLLINSFDKKTIQSIGDNNQDEFILMVYFFVLTVATVFSIDPYVSLLGQAFYHEGLLTIGCYFLIYLFAKESYKFSSSHLNLIIVSFVVLLTIGFLQFLGVDIFNGEYSGSVYSTFRNPNYYASYLVLLLPTMTYLYLVKDKFLYLVISGLALWGLLSTNTRGAWLGFIWTLIVLGVFAYLLKFNRKTLVILVVTFILVTLTFNFASDGKAMKRFSSIANDFGNTLNKEDGYERAGANRIFIWMGTVELIKEKPLIGYGIESFANIFNERFSELSEEKFGRSYYFFKAHNEYLNIAQSSGIPSLLIYLLFITYVVRKSYRKVYKNHHYLPIFLGVQGYLVQAFFNVSIVGVAQIFWFFLGLLMNEKLFDDHNMI